MEHHVNRATTVGKRVLINDGWYQWREVSFFRSDER